MLLIFLSFTDAIQELNEAVYSALLKALLAPDAGGVSWRLVRVSAAGALTSLLQVVLRGPCSCLVMPVFMDWNVL